MYREIKFTDMSKELLEQLQKGAFLTVKNGEKVNTMTIAWGSLGYMWNKPVFTAMVRESRYTHDVIENAKDFTVSLPLNGQMKNELSICGTKSGRNMDKFKECGLNLRHDEDMESPVIDNCDLHIECKIVYKQQMNDENLDGNVKERAYASGDFHTLYYGEIVKIILKDERKEV